MPFSASLHGLNFVRDKLAESGLLTNKSRDGLPCFNCDQGAPNQSRQIFLEAIDSHRSKKLPEI